MTVTWQGLDFGKNGILFNYRTVGGFCDHVANIDIGRLCFIGCHFFRVCVYAISWFNGKFREKVVKNKYEWMDEINDLAHANFRVWETNRLLLGRAGAKQDFFFVFCSLINFCEWFSREWVTWSVIVFSQ